MDNCSICKALADHPEEDVVVLEIEGVTVATTKDHIANCDGEYLAKAVEILRSHMSSGVLMEYADTNVGHWAICVVPSELAAQTKARMRAG